MSRRPLDPLPVDDVLPELLEALGRGPNAVLVAPPGAGKTTRVPPALADTVEGVVWVLEPRRIAARAAARRVAQERGWRVGEEVGYVVRFERQVGPRTRVIFATEGVLLRRLQEDPFLEGVGALVFDEFHERHLEGDLVLALARRVQGEVRPDLRLVVASATLDADPVARFLGDAPVVESDGRLHPVEVEHLAPEGRERLEDTVRRGVRAALGRSPGDLLVFLPGVGEIRRAAEALRDLVRAEGLDLQELYGELDPARQDAALSRGTRRRVVLATNVAESSVTVDGVTGVVDAGLARVVRHDARTGFDRLELSRISVASADQRAGRAGRLAPGHALRLWSLADQRVMNAAEVPEVQRLDLTGPVLQLACWGETDPAAFPWYEAPRADALERATDLLRALGALADGRPTELGRRLARLPVQPRLGRLLLAGYEHDVPARAALAAALLAERDPFERRREPPRDVAESDTLERVRALEAFEDRRAPRGELVLRSGPARGVLRARDQLLRLADRVARDVPVTVEVEDGDEGLLRALLAAFPDRLAVRREPGSDRARMVGGRGVRLAPESQVREAELFLCVDLDGAGAEARVRQASGVEREWVDGGRVRERIEPAFDPEQRRVRGVRRRYLGELLLAEEPCALSDARAAEALLVREARADLARALALDDPEVAGWRARLDSLRGWRPDLELPVVDEAALADLLPTLAVGCRSFDDLRRAPLLDHLRGLLTHAQAQALEREAPERLRVPSGSQLRLAYEPGRAPVLAVRIQELFGLPESPTVAGGRVRVLLHLLAPNHRPQQVTDDLPSFWDNTYPQVRKDLRARYPKHDWPEDPRAATPKRRPGGPRRRG